MCLKHNEKGERRQICKNVKMRLKHKRKETKMQFPKVNDNPQSLALLNNKVERRLLGAKYNNYKKLSKYKTKPKTTFEEEKNYKSILPPLTTDPPIP